MHSPSSPFQLTSGCLNDQKQPPITTTARPFAASVDIEVEVKKKKRS